MHDDQPPGVEGHGRLMWDKIVPYEKDGRRTGDGN